MESGKCKVCKCDYTTHIHIKVFIIEYIYFHWKTLLNILLLFLFILYIKSFYRKEKRSIINTEVQARLNEKTNSLETIKEFIDMVDPIVREYQKELSVIQDVIAKFSYILDTNANFVSSNSKQCKAF